MKQSFWKRFAGSGDLHDQGVIGFLHAAEVMLGQMIAGVIQFWWHTLPDFFRSFLDWALRSLRFLLRLSVRVARVAVLLAVWLALVFGPIYFFTGLLAALWMVAALFGSAWGIARHQKRRAMAAASQAAVLAIAH